jgi:hypothetical protein
MTTHLKVYEYSAADLGLKELPPGQMRLDDFNNEQRDSFLADVRAGKRDIDAFKRKVAEEQASTGVEHVDNPNDADVLVVPMILFNLQRAGIDIRHLKYMQGDLRRKHVIMDVADNFETYPDLPCIFMRGCLTQKMLHANPRSLNLAWPISRSGEFDPTPTEPRRDWPKYFVSFHAWVRGQQSLRFRAAESCKRRLGLRADVVTYPDFFGYLEGQPEGDRRRAEFKRSMRESLFALCPASITAGPDDGRGGVYPYRLFEAMAAGRPAILIVSEHVEPRPDVINYSDFVYTLPESEVDNVGDLIQKLVREQDPEYYLAMGMRARKAYYDHLDDRQWPRICREMVISLLKKEGSIK